MRVLAAAVVVLGVLGGVAAADDGLVASGPVEVAEVAGDPQEWGTTADSVATFMAHDFELWRGTETQMDPATTGRICSVSPCGWLTGVKLPTGAQIRSIELSACDSSPTAEIQFNLLIASRIPSPVAGLTPLVGTSVAGTPGCTTFVSTLATPHTVQNAANGYVLNVNGAGSGSTLQWTGVRVHYRLQVSPAPAVATFPNDVPTTSPYFRFVEAMAASGLTGGCGAGRFCPDTPVTRGQLAVFLASALGLHFPN